MRKRLNLTKEDEDKIAKIYAEKGLSKRVMCSLYEIGHKRLGKILKERGISSYPKHKKRL